MMIPTVDIAARVYNHKWKIDPIVRSLIDTDFYKLLMCQSVFRNRPDTQVAFSLINRTTRIRLADLIDEVGPDVVRFVMLTRKNDVALDFDFDKVTEQSKDNPVFYVQYANARVNSILRKARDAGLDVSDASLSAAHLAHLRHYA